LTFYEEIYCKP